MRGRIDPPETVATSSLGIFRGCGRILDYSIIASRYRKILAPLDNVLRRIRGCWRYSREAVTSLELHSTNYASSAHAQSGAREGDAGTLGGRERRAAA